MFQNPQQKLKWEYRRAQQPQWDWLPSGPPRIRLASFAGVYRPIVLGHSFGGLFLREGVVTMEHWVTWNTFYKPGWHRTHRGLLVSASLVPGALCHPTEDWPSYDWLKALCHALSEEACLVWHHFTLRPFCWLVLSWDIFHHQQFYYFCFYDAGTPKMNRGFTWKVHFLT